jgi:hypothetical protein
MRTGIVLVYSLLAFFFVNLLMSWFSPDYRKQVTWIAERLSQQPQKTGQIPIGFQDGRQSLLSSTSSIVSPKISETKPIENPQKQENKEDNTNAKSLTLPPSLVKIFGSTELQVDPKWSRVLLTLSHLLVTTTYRSNNGLVITVCGASYNTVRDKLPSAVGELYTTTETTALWGRAFFINPVNPDDQSVVRFLTSFDGRAVIIESPKNLYYSEIKPAFIGWK